MSTAVICAHNPGRRNLGMYSVDLAAKDFFSSLGTKFELVKYAGHERIGEMRYRRIGDPQDLQCFDRIVFWGDFQQNPIWGRADFANRMARERGVSDAGGYDLWKELCLFKGVDDKLPARAVSAGTCFLGLGEALKGNPFRDEYVHLLSRFAAIIPRDIASHAELVALGLTNVVQGFDCACLLNQRRSPSDPGNYFCYSFGRTLGSGSDRVVRAVEKKNGIQGKPIDWILAKRSLQRRAAAYERAMRSIAGARFVITDIYHLTINSLAARRDVYCTGKGDDLFLTTCDDYKKQVLMEMTGAAGCYLAIPPDTDDMAGYLVEHLPGMISTPTDAPRGFADRADRFRKTLTAELST